MGYKPEIHQEAVALIGYRGDKREQKAHIVIPRKQISGASNDVGLEKQSNGKYIIHISEYDESIATSGSGFQINKMKQLYAKNRLLGIVRGKSKYKLKSQMVDEDGSIRIKITRSSL